MTSLNSAAAVMDGGGGSNGHTVFVYGSLLADDVVRVLLNRIPKTSPAILHGYHRFSIKGCVYPAILPVENKKVTGRAYLRPPGFLEVLFGISARELNILDRFEDDEYEKRDVDVSLLDTSEVLQTYAYVWANSSDPNLHGEWNFEEWKESKMKDFVKMTTSFVEELEDATSSLP